MSSQAVLHTSLIMIESYGWIIMCQCLTEEIIPVLWEDLTQQSVKPAIKYASRELQTLNRILLVLLSLVVINFLRFLHHD